MTLFFITTSNYKINNIDNSIDSQKTISTELSQKNIPLNENLYIHEKKYKQYNDKLKISSRTYFKHRNLIKKVKTNCINIYEKLVNSCLLIEQPIFSINYSKNKRKRDVLRYFKCDISKLRNYLLLQIPMIKLISLFSDYEFTQNSIDVKKQNKLNLLLNMTWKEFMLHLRNDNKDITSGIEGLIKVNKKDFDIFFNYVLEINYSYDLRPSVDSLYANSLEKILSFNIQYTNDGNLKKNTINCIKEFKEIL